MEKLNKKLEELKGENKNPFSVPEGYFENFPTKIQERIISENKEQNWIIKLFNFAKPQLALSFMIIAFAFITITAIDFIFSNRTDNGVNEELYTRIIEVDASEFSEQHFIDVMFDDEYQIKNKKQEETDLYIKYLIDEDIDYITLINEF